MSSGIELSPQLWNWYVGFFISMGMVLSVAISFSFALLFIDLFYLFAKNIDTKPTPPSLWGAYFNLSRFQAIVIGVLLAPIGAISLYYLLSSLVWKLAPQGIEAPPLDFGSDSPDIFLERTASLIVYLFVLTLIIAAVIFILLYYSARKIDSERSSVGIIKKFMKRYYYENLFVGLLFMLIACPVIGYFLYNVAFLVMVIVPSTRHGVSKIAFPSAEGLYMHSLQIIGSCLIVIVFIPAAWLLLRGMLLRWCYIKGNQAMNIIFMRSLKFSSLGLFGGIGCTIMHFLAHSSFKFIIQMACR